MRRPSGGQVAWRGSSSRVGVPAWMDPLSVAAHKNLGDTAGIERAFAVCFSLGQILTPHDGDIAEVPNFGARNSGRTSFPPLA